MKQSIKVILSAIAFTLNINAEIINENLLVNTNIDNVLTFNNTDDSWQYVEFKQSNDRKTWMGLDNVSNFNIYMDDADRLIRLTSFQNVQINTGLDINTNRDHVLTFNNTDNSWQYMQFKQSGIRKTWMGLDWKNDFAITKENGGNILFNGANIGIGTNNPQNKLDVNGTIRAKEIVVETDWADYVFEDGYRLRSLSEVENHIEEHGHLPDVPSALDVESEGLSVGEAQQIMMQKIEELTLYVIAQNKEIKNLKNQLNE